MPHVNQVDTGPDGQPRRLVDRDILARTSGLSTETIRRRLTPVELDSDTGRALYDYDKSMAALADVKPRPEIRGRRQPHRQRRS